MTIIILGSLLVAACGTSASENTRSNLSSSEAAAKLPASITGLNFPVAMVFEPDGRLLITEKTTGNVRVFKDGKLQDKPFVTVAVPQGSSETEEGLLGIALDPDFSRNRFVYLYHTYEQNGQLFNRVVRVKDDGGKAGPVRVVLDKIPGGRIHDGGIIGFGPDKNLYVTTGETGDSSLAQNLGSLGGKILRVKPDGSIPKDNPFGNSPVYTLGHRNVFGLAFNPKTKKPYITENGTDRDDEINILQKGGNYGWPIVLGFSNDSRFINPIITYTPEVAPTQCLFYTGDRFSGSKGDFFFGSFLDGTIHRLKLGGSDQNQVVKDEVVYTDPSKQGIVGIVQAPDGSIYAITQKGITRVDKLSK